MAIGPCAHRAQVERGLHDRMEKAFFKMEHGRHLSIRNTRCDKIGVRILTMTRRRFLPAAAAASASLTSAAAAQTSNPAILELRTAYLRNGADTQRARMADFIEKSTLPMLQKYGAGPVAVFGNMIAHDVERKRAYSAAPLVKVTDYCDRLT